MGRGLAAAGQGHGREAVCSARRRCHLTQRAPGTGVLPPPRAAYTDAASLVFAYIGAQRYNASVASVQGAEALDVQVRRSGSDAGSGRGGLQALQSGSGRLPARLHSPALHPAATTALQPYVMAVRKDDTALAIRHVAAWYTGRAWGSAAAPPQHRTAGSSCCSCACMPRARLSAAPPRPRRLSGALAQGIMSAGNASAIFQLEEEFILGNGGEPAPYLPALVDAVTCLVPPPPGGGAGAGGG